MTQKYYDEQGNEVTVEGREPKKKGGCMKRALIIVGALFLLGFCEAMLGDSGDESDTEETTEEVAEQTEEVGEKISEEETVIEEESESNEVEALEEVDDEPVEEKSELISSEDEGILSPEFALSLMENSFEGMANVTYSSEDKAFLIEPTDQEMKTALILLLEGSTPEINASWEYLKDSFVTASNSIKDTVGERYQIHMLNPMNNENSLLIVMDGVVIYDAFSQ